MTKNPFVKSAARLLSKKDKLAFNDAQDAMFDHGMVAEVKAQVPEMTPAEFKLLTNPAAAEGTRQEMDIFLLASAENRDE